MRSLLAASKRWKWIALAAAIGAAGVGFAAPASARDNLYDPFSHFPERQRPHQSWHRHHHHHDYHRHHVRPPVVYYRPAPRYVAPPPVYYRPYYQPGVSLNFNLR
jgi:hypothetical protein